ncbi:MAG: hypothetical protein NT029_14440 [Armatimonadetes bacterium]|nr:hypothetical protein [Armatimonadota bacterium]
MKTIDLGQATEALSAYVLQTATGPVVVTDHGRVVAAMIPASDEDIETLALGENVRFMEIVQAARAEARAGQTLSAAAVRLELGLG